VKLRSRCVKARFEKEGRSHGTNVILDLPHPARDGFGLVACGGAAAWMLGELDAG
jgi:hypothetical protein